MTSHRHDTRHPRGHRHEAVGEELAHRSAAAHAHEQSRPGGGGAARRNSWCMAASAAPRATGRATTRIVATLKRLEADQTLLIQSGKPVGVFETHADAPRVLLANSNLVPRWSTWEHFNELDRKGLMMYGQMTAGSWIYIGSQGIVQGTYETFVEMGRQHFGGSLAGRWLLTAGLGGMGGAQPLAVGDGRRVVPRHRMPALAHRHAPEVRLPRSRHRQHRRGAEAHHATSCATSSPISVGLLRQRGRRSCRSSSSAACGRTC